MLCGQTHASSRTPSGAGELSAGCWGSPRPGHRAKLDITGQEGKSSLSGLCGCCWLQGQEGKSSLGAVWVLLTPWMEQSGMPCAMGYACWAGLPGESLLDPAPCPWLPHYGPNSSQELGQGLPCSQLCHSHQDRLQPPSCCLLCHKHPALFSILTMCPFDREKAPSHYSWAVIPCRLRRRWSV